MDAKINGHIEHARALGKIHAEKKNVAPARVAQIHAHRGAFAQHGIGAVLAALQQFGTHAQRMIRRMAHAKHPLVAAHGTHAAPHLIRQRLKADALIHGGQRAGNRVAGTHVFLHGQKLVQRLLKPAVQQMFKSFERNHAAGARGQFPRQMKTVNRVKEKQSANAFVKVVAAAAKGIQFGAGRDQLVRRSPRANGVERPVIGLPAPEAQRFQRELPGGPGCSRPAPVAR